MLEGKGIVVDWNMTIGAKPASSKRALAVEDPATGTVVGTVPECDSRHIRDAVASAESALQCWREEGEARRDALVRLRALVYENRDELAEIITHEEGKPLHESRKEVAGACSELEYFSGLVIQDDILTRNDHIEVRVVHRPMGVAVAITPWNFPLGTAVAKIAPALVAGCTVVLKPSPFTPLSCLRLGELSRQVLPPGVLNVISGGDRVGEALARHGVPRMVSFTGSVDSGRRVASVAGRGLKGTVLELGGNDPAILLDDVDVEVIVDELFWNVFANCGQVCVAVKRLYVPDVLYEEVVEALAEKARAVTMGRGDDPSTELGPLCNAVQRERVECLVEDAARHGAKICSGGNRGKSEGYFYEPTIISDVDDGVRVVDEEQFGPVLPIVRYHLVEDAVRRANASHFGLGASVWTGDSERGREVAEKLQAGTVWMNAHKSTVEGQPGTGIKASGLGTEGGRWGALAFTEPRVFYMKMG